jgi:predicted DCC family thiol-disulfide oxidoreductase YuxK
VLAWDRYRRLQPVALQSQRGRKLTSDLGEAERMSSWHLVVGDQRFSGGRAAAPLLRLLPGGGPIAAMLERFPGATDRAYRFVAAHRGALGRLLSRLRRRRARPG